MSPGVPLSSESTPQAELIGDHLGVRIRIVAHDAVDADVALAIAGMFTHELGHAALTGGLLHLDQALHGAISEFRARGIVTGAAGETLVLTTANPPIKAGTLLVVGLGAPEDWSPAVMRCAVARSVGEALRLEVASAAFAPSLIDSGLAVANVVGTPRAMLSGLLDGLGDKIPPALERWEFCTGPAHFDETVREFRLAFAALAGA